MKHNYLDLSDSELTNNRFPIENPSLWYHQTLESINGQMIGWIYEYYWTLELGWYTPLAFGPNIFKNQPNLLFNAKTNKRFTQRELDDMEYGELTDLIMVLSPSEYGARYGVLNSTRYTFNFTKNPKNNINPK
ncbi:hypothetical protein [Spiroplasma cantharicola]|nr:hypothetical protein [Spiroplasma cantharicola]